MPNKNNSKNMQDLVIVGAGTSGLIVALGAVKYGLKTTLICKEERCRSSSLLTKEIPSKVFCYVAKLVNNIRQAKLFGLDVQLNNISLAKINDYIKNTILDLNPEKELELFENLGGSILVGNAKFIDNHTVLVGNIQVASKYFVIATGTRNNSFNIINLNQTDFLNFSQIFSQNYLPKKLIILGGRQETLEIAQSLARFGSKITVVFEENSFLPWEDQELMVKLMMFLEKEEITFHFNIKILTFYWQNKRKLLVCQDHLGDKFVVDGDEIINLQKEQPNTEGLGLTDIKVKYSSEGILVNKKLQTTQKNIFALGSIAKTPFHSIHLSECQANIILSNIAFNIPKNLNYKLVPRILYTDPQLATVGLTQFSKPLNHLNILKFDFKNIDVAIYQQQTLGEIKLSCHKTKLLGVSILGTNSSELINEYSFAIQVGADVVELASNVHPYHSLSQINKRVSNKIFSEEQSFSNAAIDKVLIKFHQMFAKLVTAIE